MSSAHVCCAIDAQFDARSAQQRLDGYRTKGFDSATRALLSAIVDAGIDGAELLDVGGGVGALALELLDAGASRATIVEASKACVETSREQAERRGAGDRLEVIHGDFVALAPEVGPADVVTLDKVVCCYPDMERLLDASVAHARRLFGIVYPRDAWWNRVVTRAENVMRRLRGTEFRVYVHPATEIERRIVGAGLALRRRRRGLIWVTDVYERPPEGA